MLRRAFPTWSAYVKRPSQAKIYESENPDLPLHTCAHRCCKVFFSNWCNRPKSGYLPLHTYAHRGVKVDATTPAGRMPDMNKEHQETEETPRWVLLLAEYIVAETRTRARAAAKEPSSRKPKRVECKAGELG